MKFNNLQIYEMALKIKKFYEDKSLNLPVRLGFYLLKNLNKITSAAQEIELMRSNILKKYSEDLNETEKKEVFKELQELSNIEQDIDLYSLYLEDFENLKLNLDQLSLIVDMIDDSNLDEDGFEHVEA